jgi:hypothetical protein
MAAVAIAVTAWLVVPAAAQQVEITAPVPPPAPRPLVIAPGDQYDATRPSDADVYPYPPFGPRVRPDPGFIGPLSSPVLNGTGRAGVAGWTAPNVPVNNSQASGMHEVNGWFAFGLAFEWGGPPPRPGAQPRPPAR